MGKLLSCLLFGCFLSSVAGAKVLASLSCPPAHLTLLITDHLYGFPSFFLDALASLGFLLVNQSGHPVSPVSLYFLESAWVSRKCQTIQKILELFANARIFLNLLEFLERPNLLLWNPFVWWKAYLDIALCIFPFLRSAVVSAVTIT